MAEFTKRDHLRAAAVAVIAHGALALLFLHMALNVWAQVAATLEAAEVEAAFSTRLAFAFCNLIGRFRAVAASLGAVFLIADGALIYTLRAWGMRKASLVVSNVIGGLLLAGVALLAGAAWLALQGIE